MALTDLAIRHAKSQAKPFKLWDGEGLHLAVQPNGSKYWRMKCQIDGRDTVLSLGRYPALSLIEARAARQRAQTVLAAGGDPRSALKSFRDRPHWTFAVVTRMWHANHTEFLAAETARRILARFERNTFPLLGSWPIATIGRAEILEVIRQYEARGAVRVTKVHLAEIANVFRFAMVNGWAQQNPTLHLGDALKRPPPVAHFSRVALPELPALLRAINAYDGELTWRRQRITKAALIFILLTWCRSTEARFATWREFEDLDGPNPLWRIPAERMKMRREHLIPLSRQAAKLIRGLHKNRESEFLFPGKRSNQPISGNTLTSACYRMGYRGVQTVHGFRGLASTWANESLRYPSDWIEMALSHADDSVRGAYNSARYLLPRRAMLQDWSDELFRLGLADKGSASEPSPSYKPNPVEPHGSPEFRSRAKPSPMMSRRYRSVIFNRPRTGEED